MKKMAVILALFLFSLTAVKVMAVDTKNTIINLETSSLSAQINKEVDLTAPKEEGDKLVKLMKSQRVTGWWVSNSLKLAIRKAVSEGVSPNTLVLLFLFPLVAALVAFSRQVVGVSGFGMIVPSLLSVAFVSTGGMVGLVLLSFILLSAIFGRMAIRKNKIPYLPKLAVLIWIISMSVLGLLIMSPTIGLDKLMSVGIFPIMIFVLLAETFVEAQITRSLNASIEMLLETIILAFIAYKLMSSAFIQSAVVLQPEISVITILIIDFLIGKYKGLRLSEVWRFRNLLNK